MPQGLEGALREFGQDYAADVGETTKGRYRHTLITMGYDGHCRVVPSYLGIVVATQPAATEEAELVAELVRDWETTVVEFKEALQLPSEGLERETGLKAPSGKTRIEFPYRLMAGSCDRPRSRLARQTLSSAGAQFGHS
jgi:hypothetical protein